MYLQVRTVRVSGTYKKPCITQLVAKEGHAYTSIVLILLIKGVLCTTRYLRPCLVASNADTAWQIVALNDKYEHPSTNFSVSVRTTCAVDKGEWALSGTLWWCERAVINEIIS